MWSTDMESKIFASFTTLQRLFPTENRPPWKFVERPSLGGARPLYPLPPLPPLLHLSRRRPTDLSGGSFLDVSCRCWHEKHDLHEMHEARDFRKNQKGFNLKGKVESNRAGHVCCMCVLGGMHAAGGGEGDFRPGRRATKNQFMSRARNYLPGLARVYSACLEILYLY